MQSKARTAEIAAYNKRTDAIMGSMLRAWANMDGDAGEAGKRIQNAIRAIMAGIPSPSDNELNDSAEWLRLASLCMDRAANWPENGR